MIKRAVYLIALIGVTAWLIWPSSRQQEPARQQTINQLRLADYQVRGMLVRQFDDNGQLIHKISAPEARASESSFSLNNPSVEVTSIGSIWQLSARTAESNDGMNTLIFTQDVRVEQFNRNLIDSSQPMNPLAVLKTEQMTYLSQQKKLESSRNIQMQREQVSVTANKMTIDLTNENIVLGTRQ